MRTGGIRSSIAFIAVGVLTWLLANPGYSAPPQDEQRIEIIDEKWTATYSKSRNKWLKRSPYRAILASLYRERGGGPLFYTNGKPTSAATELVNTVTALDAHAVDRAPYWLGFASDGYQYKAPPKKTRRKRRTDPVALTEINDPRDLAKLDVRLGHALIQYIMDFQHYHYAHPRFQARRRDYVIEKANDAVLETARGLLQSDSLQLNALWPQLPEYSALITARARYLQLVRAHKEKQLRFPRLNHKQWKRAERRHKLSEKMITDLQVRLAAEGFYTAEVHGHLDQTTRDALATARAAHGLPSEGGVDYYFAVRANKSLRYRLDSINASLQRLRESASVRSGLKSYIRINIPEFQLELVEQGAVTRTHRVIVGNNKLDFNRHDWKQGYLNRTPLLETQVKQVIVNPTWRPPARIRDEEFEGRDNVVVEPGPKNPLGYVKFTLDRTNAVFMHDTNKRGKFKKIVRAYSHGCIRVHDAMELAEHIATRYTETDLEGFTAAKDSKKTRAFSMSKPLPVFVEYITAVPQREGGLRFFPDIYKYDRSWLRKKVPVNKVRYGSHRMRPKSVPAIPRADYTRLKSAGGRAPDVWPIGGVSETNSEAESSSHAAPSL